MITKRWWVLAEQFFPTKAYSQYGGLFVIHRICFKRSEHTDSGLLKNKFHVDFETFTVWKDRLYRDDHYARHMWPPHLKHQKLIQDWLDIS